MAPHVELWTDVVTTTMMSQGEMTNPSWSLAQATLFGNDCNGYRVLPAAAVRTGQEDPSEATYSRSISKTDGLI